MIYYDPQNMAAQMLGSNQRMLSSNQNQLGYDCLQQTPPPSIPDMEVHLNRLESLWQRLLATGNTIEHIGDRLYGARPPAVTSQKAEPSSLGLCGQMTDKISELENVAAYLDTVVSRLLQFA